MGSTSTTVVKGIHAILSCSIYTDSTLLATVAMSLLDTTGEHQLDQQD